MTTQPHLLIRPGDVPPKALVAGDPARVERIADLLTDAQEVARNRAYLVIRGRYGAKDLTLCAHGIGAPSAAIAFIELWQCGVQEIIRVGTCGAVQSGVRHGELIIALGAVRDEGTSLRYVHSTYPAIADLDLTLRLKRTAEQLGLTYREGIVWTTDTFYIPDEAETAYWRDRGILAVEMEVSLLFTLAQLRGLKAGAILAVDGNLSDGDQKHSAAWDERGAATEYDAATRKGIDAAIRIALEAI